MADSDGGVIGKGLKFKGEVSGTGSLLVEGALEGRVDLDRLTVQTGGVVDAEVDVAAAIIHGHASGNIAASERIEVKASATVLGDVRAPSIVIEEGAVFRGSVQMDVELPDDL